MHTIELEHRTETGHRIPGHEGGNGKCARLHGHSYMFVVKLSSEALDGNGFVVDFGAIKQVLDRWDHHLLLWDCDPLFTDSRLPSGALPKYEEDHVDDTGGVIRVPFVPTAENMAVHLAEAFVTEFDGVHFAEVEVRETIKSKARFYTSIEDVRKKYPQPLSVVRS